MLLCSLRPLIVLLVLIAPLCARAQTIGIDGGVMRDFEHGVIESTCGCAFDDAKGIGITGAFSAEASMGAGFFAGVRIGYESQNVSANKTLNETAIVQDANGSTDTALLQITRKLDLTFGYMTAMPFIEYKVPVVGVFVQSGFTTMYPLSSSWKLTRELNQTSAIIDGKASNDLKFQNGSTTEPIDDVNPVPELNSPQFAASFAIGEEFELLETKCFVAARANIPLTDVQSIASWRITSLGAVVGMKFEIK
jgi:hypothetical protein